MPISPEDAADALDKSDRNLLEKAKKRPLSAAETRRLQNIVLEGEIASEALERAEEAVEAAEQTAVADESKRDADGIIVIDGKSYAKTAVQAADWLGIGDKTVRRVRTKSPGIFPMSEHGHGPLEEWQAQYREYLEEATKRPQGIRALGKVELSEAETEDFSTADLYAQLKRDTARLYATKEAAWRQGDVTLIEFTTKMYERARDAQLKAERDLKDEQKKAGELMHQDVARKVFYQLGAAIGRTGPKVTEKIAKEAAKMKDPRKIARELWQIMPNTLLDFLELAVSGEKLPEWAIEGLLEGLGISGPKSAKRQVQKKASKRNAKKKAAKKRPKKPPDLRSKNVTSASK